MTKRMLNLNHGLDPNGNPHSKFVQTAIERHTVFKESEKKPHPYRWIAVTSQNFAKSFNAFSEATSDPIRIKQKENNDEIVALLADLSYRSAELFEFFDKIVHAIPLRNSKEAREKKNNYRSAVNKASDDWVILCNSLKHNANTLANVEFFYPKENHIIKGFRLLQPARGSEVQVNKDYHKKGERERSYIVALHQLVFAVMKCEHLAAELLTWTYGDNDAADYSHDLKYEIGNSLKKLANQRIFAFPEQPTMFNGFVLRDETMTLCRMQAIRINADADVTVRFKTDGFTKTYPI
ncbi:hypothetical protein BBL07_23610 [Agrobacterium vitis]|nr:hypothetical protein BBL07_23610 [Agrobacterium vitis]